MATVKGVIRMDPKEAATIVWQYWYRTTMNDTSISIKDITNIIIAYYNIAKILKWSQKYKSKTKDAFEFSDDDTCIKRLKDEGWGYKWICADIEPVNEGIHCWRVETKHEQKGGWIVYGVSPPNKELGDSCGQPHVWGVTYNDCWYPNGSNRLYSGSVCDHLYQKNIDVDILLNLEEKTLNIGIVGMLDDEHEYKFKGISKTNEYGGWIPHFNLYLNGNKCDTAGCQLRIAQIPPELYGEKVEYDMFASYQKAK